MPYLSASPPTKTPPSRPPHNGPLQIRHRNSVPDHLAAAANGYLSYAGPYSLVDDGLIAHHIDVSLLPNWIGGTQYRAALLHGSVLELSPPEPILVGGQRLNARLVWHRA